MLTQRELLDIKEIVDDLDIEKIRGQVFFISGATGSLARYIVHTLLYIFEKENDTDGLVYVLCRNERKAKELFHDYLNCKNFIIVVGSVENFTVPIGGIDYIFHAASVSNSAFFRTNPVEILSANTIGTSNLLEMAKKKKVKGFLFFSSGAVYGGERKDDFSYNGINPLNANNCYSFGKIVGENLCVAYNSEYDVPTKIVRIGYTYGPYMDLNDGHLYSDFVKSIVEGRNIVIKGDGQKYIGMCYVTDAVRAFFKIILDGDICKPYVMRNYKEVMRIEDMASILTAKVFKEKHLIYSCLKSGERQMEPEKRDGGLLGKLGWQPSVMLGEGFKRTVEVIEQMKLTEKSLL